MAIRHDLTLPEEVLLLALHDDRGTVAFGSMYAYAVAGGIIAELALRRRIDVERVKRSMLVNVIDATPVGDPLLDAALEKMRTAKRRASAQAWVQRLAQLPARKRLIDRLHQKGIVRRDEGRVLFIFTRDVWPAADPAPERDAVDRMRRAIFEDDQPDVRTAILAALAHRTGLLGNVFGRKELKGRKKRIDQLAALHPAGEAAGEAVRAAQAAVQAANAAVVAAITASTAAATS